MTKFTDEYWTSRDGLKLHYRDYPGRVDRPPVVCLPGLTRNARDSAQLAEKLAGDWRVLLPEMRGRAESEYARDAATYNPLQYVEDLTVLLDEQQIDRFVSVGTSLGGLMTFLIAMTTPQRIAAAVINDVGPELEPEGLARIAGYVGQGRNYSTWVHAARGLEESQGIAFPKYGIDDWIGMAKRLMTLTPNGRIVYDYDMKIGEAFKGDAPPAQPDLWPALDGLAGKPVLIVRGSLSDLFSQATLDRMLAALPQAESVVLPEIGHAPTLQEPEAVAAIERLLGKVG